MKRLFTRAPKPPSREEVERQAAAELAAATGLGTMDSPAPQPDHEEVQPTQP